MNSHTLISSSCVFYRVLQKEFDRIHFMSACPDVTPAHHVSADIRWIHTLLLF